MTFENLTPTWPDRPLTDPAHATDVVDLFVSHGDRSQGSLTAILCDPDAHYRAAVTVDLHAELAAQPLTLATPDLCATALTPIIPAIRTAPGTRLLLALGRPDPPFYPDLDHDWSTAAHALTRTAQIPFLGFYVATPTRIYQPHPLNSQAA